MRLLKDQQQRHFERKPQETPECVPEHLKRFVPIYTVPMHAKEEVFNDEFRPQARCIPFIQVR